MPSDTTTDLPAVFLPAELHTQLEATAQDLGLPVALVVELALRDGLSGLLNDDVLLEMLKEHHRSMLQAES